MYFTTLNSFYDIMNYRGMKDYIDYLVLPDRQAYYDAEHRDIPLRLAGFLLQDKDGNDLRGLSDAIADSANLVLDIERGERKCLDLDQWKSCVPDGSPFLITTRRSNGVKRPAFIICPGGGYVRTSFVNEGTPVQNLLELNGYAAFTLNYTTNPASYPKPQMDLLRTCQYIKEHADEYDVDPDRIVFAGFSAGGHLAASAAGLAETLLPGTRPQGVLLGYPVISLKDSITHEETRENLLKGARLVTKEASDRNTLIAELSVENIVDDDFPPTYCFHCSDDGSVSAENTSILADALDMHDVKHLCEIYPTGGHGIGLGYGTSAYTWSERMLDFFSMIL